MDQARLAHKFREQQAFAAGYSPLYERLFGVLSGWLDAPGAANDPLVQWLLHAGRQRHTLDVTLLLAAGLHRAVLAGKSSAAGLAAYYSTAGHHQSPGDPGFAATLRQAILANREELAAFIGAATVQTNETGRGLCWLLPLLATGWPAVYLVDLGASAGLNLVAEQRAYRLVEAGSGEALLDLGQAPPVQVVTRCRGETAALVRYRGLPLPHIAGRLGCDLAPFPLATPADEQTLLSFIWGDQVQRLERLREALAAFHRAQQSDAPVRLFPANLPGELPDFLHRHVPAAPSYPVVIYNTCVTTYLDDKGQALGKHIGAWAATQPRPVLWLQWEPPRDGRQPPGMGWCAWTADRWQGGERRHWRLGWVHPHGQAAELETELGSFGDG